MKSHWLLLCNDWESSLLIRSKRRSYLEGSMSPYLLSALFIMSISIIYPFFTKTPEEGGPAVYTMIFMMGTLLSFMFITMLDISRPFAGYWSVKLESFTEIRNELESSIDQSVDAASRLASFDRDGTGGEEYSPIQSQMEPNQR